MLARHVHLRLLRTPLAPAAAGIFATLAIVAAFRLPAVGPAWFTDPGGTYLIASMFAVFAWGAPTIAAPNPSNTWRDLASTALLFALLTAITVPPLAWAVRLGESPPGQALRQSLLLLLLCPALGTLMLHALPRPWRRAYDATALGILTQLAALWAILAA